MPLPVSFWQRRDLCHRRPPLALLRLPASCFRLSLSRPPSPSLCRCLKTCRFSCFWGPAAPQWGLWGKLLVCLCLGAWGPPLSGLLLPLCLCLCLRLHLRLRLHLCLWICLCLCLCLSLHLWLWMCLHLCLCSEIHLGRAMIPRLGN